MTENSTGTDGLVSVIIPAYNHEKYVGPAVRSVVEQTYPDIELLLVDDGSPDGTWEVIRSLEEDCRNRFRRVEFFRQENKGVCETLNTLLAKVRGEYLLRLDSDDLIKPHSIEKQLAFLRENPDYGLTVGDNELIDENGRVVYWTRERENTADPDRAAFKTFGDYLRDLRPDVDFLSDDFGRYETFWANYIPNGYLIRREITDRLNFSARTPREDFYMMLQLAKRAKFKYFDEVLHSYRWHPTNNIKAWEKSILLTNQTRKDELRRLKADGDRERYRLMFDLLINWKKRTKLKLGGLELYRVMDIFDERKLYCLRLGDRKWPLFELRRENTETRTPWRPGRARPDEDFIF